MVKSAKARDLRRRSRAKFNLLSAGATRLGALHSQILAYLILLSLLWHVVKSFVRFFFSSSNASLMFYEDYIILYELLSSRIPDFAYESNCFDLDEMNDDECKAEFGVRKCHTCETSFICCRNKI